MSSNWFKAYRELVVRSRAIGIVGTCLMILAVFNELYATYQSMLIAEIALEPNWPRGVLIQVGLVVLVGIVFCVRVGVLLLAKRLSFLCQSFSWWLSFAVAALYVYLTAPFYQESTVCDANGICYGIYDMSRRSNLVVLVTWFWPIMSLVRFATTAAYAAYTVRHKLT